MISVAFRFKVVTSSVRMEVILKWHSLKSKHGKPAYNAAKCAASSSGAEKKGEWLVSIEITF